MPDHSAEGTSNTPSEATVPYHVLFARDRIGYLAHPPTHVTRRSATVTFLNLTRRSVQVVLPSGVFRPSAFSIAPLGNATTQVIGGEVGGVYAYDAKFGLSHAKVVGASDAQVDSFDAQVDPSDDEFLAVGNSSPRIIIDG